jgi:Tol biopolymer transport system component
MKHSFIVSIVTLPIVLLAVLSMAPAMSPAQRGNLQTRRQLKVYDRAGNVLSTLGDFSGPGDPVPVFSPDGTRVAVAGFRTSQSGLRANGQVWVFDLSSGASTQITSGSGVQWQVAWSPDGSEIAFVAERNGYDGLYRKAANGTGNEELLYRHFELQNDNQVLAHIHNTMDWSPDGRFLCFESGGVLFVVPLNGDRKAVEIIREEYEVSGPRFSPDGRFLAYRIYDARIAHRYEIYVSAFDPATGRLSADGGKWQVSSQGGSGIFWPRSGEELYYIAPDGGLMAVEVSTKPSFRAGAPKYLFRAPVNFGKYVLGNVSPDGRRFVFVAAAPQ